MMILKSIAILAFLALSASPTLRAQCHGGSSGHSGHGSDGGHSSHDDSKPVRIKARNTICPVRGSAVKQGKDPEVALSGGLYVVCCPECRSELTEHREKYLDPDGRPKNEPKQEDPQASKEPDQAPAEHHHE